MVEKTVAPAEFKTFAHSRRKNLGSAIALSIGFALFILGIKMHSDIAKYKIEVLFPLRLLKSDPTVLDPNNLETTPEYYLLENIAVGLLRDSSLAPSGYEGEIAKSWSRPNRNEWRFKIRENLKYSDGSNVRIKEIVEALERRAKSNARHLKILPSVKKITFTEVPGEISMIFPTEIGEGLLSELALADAAIITKQTVDSGWRKTIAPYAIKTYFYGKRLLLERNDYFFRRYKKAPLFVDLKFSDDEETRLSWFKKKQIDLFDASAFTFKKRNTLIEKLGYESIYNQPNVIHFFVANPNNSSAKANPNLLGFLFDEFDSSIFGEKKGFARYRQLIPPGYSGEIPDLKPLTATRPPRAITGKIALFKDFQEWPEIKRGIESTAKRLGWKIKVIYFDRFSPFEMSDDVIARSYVFKGNQKDAKGSWSFLFHAEHGPLSPYRSKSKYFVEGKTTVKDLIKLHREVLKKGWATPFLIESPMIFYTSRLSLKKWNPFDLRLRFYEVEEK
jgi:hypothetical protein